MEKEICNSFVKVTIVIIMMHDKCLGWKGTKFVHAVFKKQYIHGSRT